MAVDRSELRLTWPAGLFATEARTLLSARPCVDEDDVRSLLEEAFAEGRAAKLLAETGTLYSDNPDGRVPWAPTDMGYVFDTKTGYGVGPGGHLLVDLIKDAEAGRIPLYERPRYWTARQRSATAEPAGLSRFETAREFTDITAQLDSLGYFDDAFGSSCPEQAHDHDAEAERVLEERLGPYPELAWPLRQNNPLVLLSAASPWSEPADVHDLDKTDLDLVFDLIEALHDVIARPRRRRRHHCRDGSCQQRWEYADFSRGTGRTVYRWRVNELLARTDLGLRLADTGLDAGRLVHVTEDDRNDLVRNALATPEPAVRTTVEHAVQQFRSRTATREDKRLAVVALAGLYEEREQVLRTGGLLKEDERALGHIANKFNLRHRNGKQQGDYSEDFLEWLYWWYLATVELTDRLIARRSANPDPPGPTAPSASPAGEPGALDGEV